MSTQVAVILAAGVGSRLRPLTDDRPKTLVEVGCETMLGRAVRLLAEHGVGRLVVATGYREAAVAAALESAPMEVVLRRNPRYDTTQNVASLAACGEAVGGRSFFKLDGDVVFQPEVLRRLEACPTDLAVAVDSRRRLDAEAMKVAVGHGDEIVAFGKTVSVQDAAGETLGIERVEAEVAGPLFDAVTKAVEEGRVDLYYEDVYSDLVARGALCARAVEVGDLPWSEVDDLEDLERARALLG